MQQSQVRSYPDSLQILYNLPPFLSQIRSALALVFLEVLTIYANSVWPSCLTIEYLPSPAGTAAAILRFPLVSVAYSAGKSSL